MDEHLVTYVDIFVSLYLMVRLQSFKKLTKNYAEYWFLDAKSNTVFGIVT